MALSDEDLFPVVDAFSAAAVGAEDWRAALGRLAEATGSEAGQLIGYGGLERDPFMWVSDPDPSWLERAAEYGATDPNINPRLAVGLRTPVLRLLTDQDVIGRDERRRHPLYADYFDPSDRPFISATNLVNEDRRWTGLAVLRTHRQGEITDRQRAVFAALAPHVRAAVHAQTVLESRGAEVLAGALEMLSLAVFILDGRGAVRAMTAAAEELVTGGAPLSLRAGRLHGGRNDEARCLGEAIRLAVGAARLSEPQQRTLLLSCGTDRPLVLDVIPLPRRPHGLGYDPRALVVARGAERSRARAKQLLQSAFRLTAAEAEVALLLTGGESPDAIAAGRGVALGTVRTQIKAAHAKLGVHRQGELIARVNQLY